MPGFPMHNQTLSFRPKYTRDASNAHQSFANEQAHETTMTQNDAAARLASEYTVDQEQVFQDVSRLAARSGYQHTPAHDIDVEEARRLIELEVANAAARYALFTGQQISPRRKVHAKGRIGRKFRNRNEQSEGDGLDDLERLMSMAGHEEQVAQDRPIQDGPDDLNRPIAMNEQSVDGIAGEMDIEFGGMRDALAAEVQWLNSSDAQRAALEKTMQLARGHGDYISRFEPEIYEDLARMQQQLFQTAGQDSNSVQVHQASGNGFQTVSSAKVEMATYKKRNVSGLVQNSNVMQNQGFARTQMERTLQRDLPEAEYGNDQNGDSMEID